MSSPAWPSTDIDLLEGMATTRAIRRYRSDPIPPPDLAAILWHATRAPSGSNRQPYRFVVLQDGPGAAAAKVALGTSFRESWAAKRAADRYDEGSGADPRSPKGRMAAAMQRFVDGFEEVPVVVLPCYVPYRDGTHLTDGASIYPACQNLLLAARALGYGGVLTVWHRMVEEELKELLGIPAEVTIAATIPLGRPEGSHGPLRRRPLARVVFDDTWGHLAEWAADPPEARLTAGGPPS